MISRDRAFSRSGKLLDAGDVGIDDHGIVGVVDDKPGFGTGHFFDMLLFHIIDLNLVGFFILGVVGGQAGGLFKSPVRKLFSVCLHDDM